MTKVPWDWVAGGACGFVLVGLIVLGRLPLLLAAASSVALAGMLVLATMKNRPKFMLLFFLNSCLLVVPSREVGGIDFVVLLSLLTAVTAAFGLASKRNALLVTETSPVGGSNFGAVQFALIGIAAWSIISNISNSQSLISLLPWLNGIVLAFLISCAPQGQLPSFSSVRRAVLVGGAIAVAYDIYLYAAGRALNVGIFNAGRFVGSLADYELVAEFYGAIILLCMSAVFFDGSKKWRLASGALILPSFVLLLATQSRGPMVILFAVVPLLALICAFLFRESARKIAAVVGILAGAICASIGTLSTMPLFARLSMIQLDGGIESALNRASVWDYFTQLPRFVEAGLVGNGFDYPYEEVGTFPHSLYLWLIWSGGYVILIFFGLLVFFILCKLLRGISLRHSASLSAAAMIMYILLDEVKIEAARTAPSVCFLWVVLSLAILASREQKEL